ncbi:6-bladed beta-propeller [Melioribacteraceae bacterium 4301-Me]|uniref:6-bladed beta-propeller n=1 Tax=Pyranulibacter aquaticus TaxID=3163344 RepID=UPI003598A8D2
MKKYLSMLIVILLIACNSDEFKSKITTEDLGTLEPNKKLQRLSKFNNFGDIFTLKRKVQLETTLQNVMGRPWSVIIQNDRIIIIDLITAKSIFVFSGSGRYIGTIGRVGDGPGEFRSPNLAALVSDKLFIYDPILSRISVFSVNDRNYLRSWGVRNFYESMTTVNGKLAMLNRVGQGYETDFEIFDSLGNKISSSTFPKSLSEEKRRFMFGGSFRLSSYNNKLLYIGADEFKIICYDINAGKVLWISQEIPSVLKVPKELPPNFGELGINRIKWLKNNYSSLLDFFCFNNGLIIVLADDYFLLYDNNGNFITAVKSPNDKDYFTTDGNYLYEITEPYINDNKDVVNPKVYVYEVANAELNY